MADIDSPKPKYSLGVVKEELTRFAVRAALLSLCLSGPVLYVKRHPTILQEFLISQASGLINSTDPRMVNYRREVTKNRQRCTELTRLAHSQQQVCVPLRPADFGTATALQVQRYTACMQLPQLTATLALPFCTK